MTEQSQFAARLIEGSAGGYAGFAAAQLLEEHPEAAAPFGSSAFDLWRANLEQRLFELASALAFGEPSLFAGEVRWSKATFEAREVPVEHLRTSLVTLGKILENELPEASRPVVAEYLEVALGALDEPATDEAQLDPQEPHQKLALRYLEAVLDGDRRQGTELILQATNNGLDPVTAYEQVLVPAQRQIGRMWHGGLINVAEEHAATAATQRTMAILSHRLEPAPPNGKTVVAASVQGNVHDMGLRVVADLFEIHGWKSVLLGSDVPMRDVVEACVGFSADLLVLSGTLATHLSILKRSIDELRQATPSSPIKVLVGGLALDRSPDLWRSVGADGYARDALQAVTEGARLVGLEGDEAS